MATASGRCTVLCSHVSIFWSEALTVTVRVFAGVITPGDKLITAREHQLRRQVERMFETHLCVLSMSACSLSTPSGSSLRAMRGAIAIAISFAKLLLNLSRGS